VGAAPAPWRLAAAQRPRRAAGRMAAAPPRPLRATTRARRRETATNTLVAGDCRNSDARALLCRTRPTQPEPETRMVCGMLRGARRVLVMPAGAFAASRPVDKPQSKARSGWPAARCTRANLRPRADSTLSIRVPARARHGNKTVAEKSSWTSVYVSARRRGATAGTRRRLDPSPVPGASRVGRDLRGVGSRAAPGHLRKCHIHHMCLLLCTTHPSCRSAPSCVSSRP
jgi:hypothetical protein